MYGAGYLPYTASMVTTHPTLRDVFEVLNATTDAGEWWPADSRFEILVGAVLTQNTNWTNVERCIANLKAANTLTPEAIKALPIAHLQDLIKPSGYWRVKATYLHALTDWFLALDRQAISMDDETLRTSLLRVHGVGQETADDILLYAYHRPVFIYDLYARRLLAATGFGEYKTYLKAKRALDPIVIAEAFTTQELADFHGLIVQAGKDARAAGGWATHWAALTAQP